MSVQDKDTIDAIAITQDGNGLILLITDHLEWTDEYKHLLELQDKINAYIMFLENEQYKEVYKNRDFQYKTIEIHFMYKLTENAKRFLQTVERQVYEMGIMIKYVISEREIKEGYLV